MTDDLLRKLRSGSNMVIPKGYIDAVPVHLRGDYHRFVEDIERMEKIGKKAADTISNLEHELEQTRKQGQEALKQSDYLRSEFGKCRIELEKCENKYDELVNDYEQYKDECPIRRE